MAATVSITSGRVAPLNTLAAIELSIDANGVSYATSLGGLAFDLYAAIQAASPGAGATTINASDIRGFVPKTVSSPGGWNPMGLTVGTPTSSTIPCFIRLYGADGTAAGKAGLAEIADGANTQVITGFLLIHRGGTN